MSEGVTHLQLSFARQVLGQLITRGKTHKFLSHKKPLEVSSRQLYNKKCTTQLKSG